MITQRILLISLMFALAFSSAATEQNQAPSSPPMNIGTTPTEASEALMEQASQLKKKGEYKEAAKIYRKAAQSSKGQEYEDGTSISDWATANANICDCFVTRATEGEQNIETLLRRLKLALSGNNNSQKLAELLSCEVATGPMNSHYEVPVGPDKTAKLLVKEKIMFLKRAQQNDVLVLGGSIPPNQVIDRVYVAKKSKKGWFVTEVLTGTNFAFYVADRLPGAKIADEKKLDRHKLPPSHSRQVILFSPPCW